MGVLYIVPTPIGNLEDMTFRAINVLKEVDHILAEDTRTSGKLMKHFEIGTTMSSFHLNNEHKVVSRWVNELEAGKNIALISDAGTPAISDPGFLLVREAVKAGVEVITLPGATAFVPALVNSGLPCEKFHYEGFLPHKKGRQTRIAELVEKDVTSVLYESPHRLLKTLGQLLEAAGEERLVSVSREISKLHEETVRGTIPEVIEHFENNPIKGEFVLVLAPSNSPKGERRYPVRMLV
ncbi:MAG: 16S rRNA (cytidine(1402)-2'-O)-methyltransferase [Flavobacteriales bacterium]|nr:16S rRNA (cytidine(1402)-2'-O)-methyltransferase [Flavobacteriales bacterium]